MEEAWLPHYRGAPRNFTAEQPTTADEVWAPAAAGRAISVLPEFMVGASLGDGRAVPLSHVEPLKVALARRRDDSRAILDTLFEAAGAPAAEEQPAAGSVV